MKEFLRLIRWPNLLIIILTMVLIRYAVLAPLLSKTGVILINQGNGEEVSMVLMQPWLQFVILVAAVVLLTAAGYVINDYFDIRTDLINKGTVIVGTVISRRKAMLLHNVFNFAAVLAGFYVSWKAGYFWLGTLFLIVSGLLYFYSASYKRQFLIGNLLVSVLAASMPLLVVCFEWPFLFKYYSANAIELPPLSFLFYWTGGFALFAFLTTLTREIVKDIEDFEGDSEFGRNTLPVIMGLRTSRLVAAALMLLTLVLLFLVWYFFLNDKITLVYMSVAIALPLAYNIYAILTAEGKEQLHRSSTVMKLVMLSGILYSLVVKAIIEWNLVQ
jgi:4-hydroxybenzoate polyprenyltransferase